MKTKKYAISFTFPKFKTHFFVDSTNVKMAEGEACEQMYNELKSWYSDITHNKRAKVTKKILILKNSSKKYEQDRLPTVR